MDTAFSTLDSPSFNPFVLLVDSDQVLAAVRRSDRLNALTGKVVRLLDAHGPDGDEGGTQALDG